MLKIYTDSAADIFNSQAKELDLGVFELGVHFEDGPYQYPELEDGARFFSYMEKINEIPTTSSIVPGEFIKVFEEAKKSGDEIIYIGMSSGLTSAMDTAKSIKEMLEYDGIYLIDSKHISVSQAILVEYACKMRDEAKSAAEIKEEIDSLTAKTKLFGALAGLDHLKKGGRFSAGLMLLGSLMNIKPIIAIDQEGKIGLIAKARGHAAAYKRLLKELENDIKEDKIDRRFPIQFAYTSGDDIAMDLLNRAKELGGDYDYPDPKQMGPVIGTHVGPGLIAISYLVK